MYAAVARVQKHVVHSVKDAAYLATVKSCQGAEAEACCRTFATTCRASSVDSQHLNGAEASNDCQNCHQSQPIEYFYID
jgi:hypothetical protein